MPMAKKSRMSILKRQREVKRKEKAARKRAKKHGRPVEGFTEPVGTPIRLLRPSSDESEGQAGPSGMSAPARPEPSSD